MNVLLTTLNSKFIHTNLAIRYIREYSRYLEGENYKLYLKEYTINNSIDFIMKDIFKKKLDIIVFSVYIWNVEDVIRICENIKKVNPSVKIALGGPEVTYDVEDAMKKYPYIDYIFYGEGEVIYRDFIISMIDNKDVSDVLGISYRDEDGNIIINDQMPLIENLDDIPSPYENIDIEEYKNKIVYFESSRGCPFNCQYCLSSAIKGLRYFSVDRIKRDLKNLIDANVSQIKFIDRTFNANRRIAKEIMTFLMENDNGYTTYHFEVTAHLIDDGMLDFLKNCKPGLFQFEIGVQSTNEKTLLEVGRTDDFERLSKVVKRIGGYRNIHQHLDLIAGLPYEDYKRFSKSFDDVFSLGIECLQLGFLKMIKGTGIRNRSDVHGYKYKNYPPYEILSNNYMSYDEIIRLKDIEEILEVYYNSGNFKTSVRYVIDNYYERPFLFFENFAIFFDSKGYFDISHNRNRLYEIFLEFFEEVVGYNVKKDKRLRNNITNKTQKEDEGFIDSIDNKAKKEDNGAKKEINESKKEGNEVKKEGIECSLSGYDEVDVFRELLKLDFLSLGKPSSIPKFFNKIEVDDYKNICHKFLQDKENQRRYTPEYYDTPAKNIIRYVHFEQFKYNVEDIKNNPRASIVDKENTVLFYYNTDKVFEKAYTYKVELPDIRSEYI